MKCAAMTGNPSLSVLGDFQVVRDGLPVPLPQSRKTRALLAFLAVNGRRHQRERLCEMFWDVPDDPRGALRWSLSKIRSVLTGVEGVELVADRNGVSLAKKSTVLDYDGFHPFLKTPP